jgi:hypothetical protein
LSLSAREADGGADARSAGGALLTSPTAPPRRAGRRRLRPPRALCPRRCSAARRPPRLFAPGLFTPVTESRTLTSASLPRPALRITTVTLDSCASSASSVCCCCILRHLSLSNLFPHLSLTSLRHVRSSLHLASTHTHTHSTSSASHLTVGLISSAPTPLARHLLFAAFLALKSRVFLRHVSRTSVRSCTPKKESFFCTSPCRHRVACTHHHAFTWRHRRQCCSVIIQRRRPFRRGRLSTAPRPLARSSTSS